MTMRSRLMTVGIAAFVSAAVVAIAAEAPATTSTHPPKNLKKAGDHWTPWDPPAATADSYLIQKGDTLWDLAQKWLGDPHLWPQVWDQNRYVLDSHWIYPGDPLAVPAKPNVVPPEGPAPTAEAKPAEPEHVAETTASSGNDGQAPAAPATPMAPAPMRLADRHDLYCSGWIEGERHPSALVLAGAEMEKDLQSQGDIVYLNQGRNQGINAGAEYLVVRADHKVVHPATKEKLGTYIQRMGHVRVLCSQENAATAVVVDACEGMHRGDELLPWTQLSAPELAHVPGMDRCAAPSGLAQGWVIDGGSDQLHAVGLGNVVSTDLGSDAGIRPGSLLTLFRDNGDLPRMVLGEAVVLTVDGSTSTVKVLQSAREVRLGDRAEVLQQ